VNGPPLIRLHANENPYGTSPPALAAIRGGGSYNRYADDDHADLRAALAARYGVESNRIVLGHGSNELIGLLCETLAPGKPTAVLATPTFSLYRRFVQINNGRLIEVPLRDDGTHDVGAMCGAAQNGAALLVVCDPNNPTGTALRRAQWEHLLQRVPPEVLLVVDQAYAEYSNAAVIATETLLQRPRTLILRTFSKIYGLAALRIGYGVGDPATIAQINSVRMPYNVSEIAARAAMAALQDEEFPAETRRKNERERALFEKALRGIGLSSFASEANFLSVAVPVPAHRAHQDLLQRGVHVRSGDALQMPGRLRISVGTHEENQRCVEALRQCAQEWATAC